MRSDVHAVDEAGHTPGYVGIMMKYGGDTCLFWNDLLHAFDAQEAMPSVSASFDMDPDAAARVREDTLKRVRAGGWLVVGSCSLHAAACAAAGCHAVRE